MDWSTSLAGTGGAVTFCEDSQVSRRFFFVRGSPESDDNFLRQRSRRCCFSTSDSAVDNDDVYSARVRVVITVINQPDKQLQDQCYLESKKPISSATAEKQCIVCLGVIRRQFFHKNIYCKGLHISRYLITDAAVCEDAVCEKLQFTNFIGFTTVRWSPDSTVCVCLLSNFCSSLPLSFGAPAH